MKTKYKVIICLFLFVVGAFFNLFFTTALHGILSGKSHTLAFTPFAGCIASLIASKQHLLLFLCLQGLVGVVSTMFFFTNHRPYQSELAHITPQIETPVPVGQHQHGSSRWLTEQEKQSAFDTLILDLKHPLIRELIATGYDHLEFYQRGEEEQSHEVSGEHFKE